ncbi:MAG: hypothetical protein IH587_05110, partial [Anaerolineae bacterium]|nr:hypothetical protein [Anaerolineae bacterium]
MIAKQAYRFGWMILITLVCLVWFSSVQAQENDNLLIVAPDSNYATIDAALAAANPGDVIEVHGGVYAAPLII